MSDEIERLCRCADEVRCEMKAEIERLRKRERDVRDAFEVIVAALVAATFGVVLWGAWNLLF